MVRSIVVALSGPSGSGKSTAVAGLAQRPGWRALDEAFYRLRPRPGLGYRSSAELVALELRLLAEERRRFGEALRLAEAGVSVVADTGFLDPVDYTAGLVHLGLAPPGVLRPVLARARSFVRDGALGVADLTVHLQVSRRVRAGRVASDPRGHPRAFRERHELVGSMVARTVRPSIARALPGRVRVLRAFDRPAVLVARIERLAARTSPWADPSAAAERWLDVLERLVREPAGRRRSGSPRRRSGQS